MKTIAERINRSGPQLNTIQEEGTQMTLPDDDKAAVTLALIDYCQAFSTLDAQAVAAPLRQERSFQRLIERRGFATSPAER